MSDLAPGTIENGAAATAEPVNPYDRIAYVSAVSAQVDPDRVATIARLHGIAAPRLATARVLEIGGGDGLNLAAFATSFPDSRCLNFDLAASAVERGRRLVEAAGLDNIRIEQMDILDAERTLDGEFDYIIVHGVYAWVPAPVRAAIMRLIGRVLAPTGAAIITYNALPGQYLSLTLRAMIGAMLTDVPLGEERVERAVAFLNDYADKGSDKDNAFTAALRKRAKDLAGRSRALLAHDEFGACFEPQAFEDVCEAAAGAGLAYLNDSVYLSWEHGFSAAGADPEVLRRSMQIHDHQTGCLFRHSIFVRAGQPIQRRFDPAMARDLSMTSVAHADAVGKYSLGSNKFEIADQRLDAILREAARCYPAPYPLTDLSDDRIVTLVRLFLGQGVFLSTEPNPAGGASAHPRISSFSRAQIERGDAFVTGLDRQSTPLSDDFRTLLLLLDGTRDAAALAKEVGIGEAEGIAFIGLASQRGLLMR